jgi:peptide deformylase
MAIRKIVTLPEKILRSKARRVSDFGPDLKELIDDMVETMREAPGVGLEFGDLDDEEVPLKLYTIVNPEITRASTDVEIGTEGCLSIPGVVGDVERHVSVTVKGQDPNGRPLKIKSSGWLARIFQHEIDHIDGVLFVDRATRVWQPGEEEEVV